jgi:stringent starvation protein B
MSAILEFMPWWGWTIAAAPLAFLALRYLGFNGMIAVLVAGAAAAVYAKGRKAGVAVERDKQVQADNKSRTTIHDIKEDVRSIPSTPAGDQQRKDRFNRWGK